MIDEEILYWVSECANEFPINAKVVALQFQKLKDMDALQSFELPKKRGIVVWTISPDLMGSFCVHELFLYVKPKYRNDPRNFITLIKVLEQQAKFMQLSLRIASSFDYRDNKMLQWLLKRGYRIDTVRKEL